MWFTLLAEKVPPACFGGVARLFNTVKEIKADEENVIFLNGGDMFQGNVWYSQFKWRVIAQFTNYLNFTASVSISTKDQVNPNNVLFDLIQWICVCRIIDCSLPEIMSLMTRYLDFHHLLKISRILWCVRTVISEATLSFKF